MTAPDRDEIVLVYTKTARPWLPYKGSFPADRPVFRAIAFPGGFAGFGYSADDACNMAKARVVAALNRSLRLGHSHAQWLEAASRRITPIVAAMIERLRETGSLTPFDAFDGLNVVRGASDELADLAPSELRAA